MRSALSLVLLLVGCAAEAREPARPRDPGHWVTASEEAQAGRSSHSLPAAPLPVARTRVADAAPASTRPPRARHVDARFSGADLADVARILADAGRFAVIVDDSARAQVTVDLSHVEPFDALQVIAEAKGLRVGWDGRVALVTGK